MAFSATGGKRRRKKSGGKRRSKRHGGKSRRSHRR